MNTWIFINLLSVLFVQLLTGLLIPQILLIAFRKNLFDNPDERKLHAKPVPRLGGITFLPVLFFTVLLVFAIGLASDASWLYQVCAHDEIKEALFLGCAMISLYIVGVADDLIGIRYSAKFMAQIMDAMLLVSGGVILDDLHGLFGMHEINGIVSVLLTVLVIVFITSAINLIDGIDGLASGLGMIACAIYGYICLTNEAYLFSLIAFCTFGTLFSFFCFNVLGNVEKHNKIFMGDTGTLTIGIILSALSLYVCKIPDADQGLNHAVAAFAPLLLPGLDVVRVYLHRLRNHVSPFLQDKNHIHHKLLALGMNQRVAMPTILAVSLLLTLVNIHLSSHIGITLIFTFDILLWTLANIVLTRAIRCRERRLGSTLYQ